MSDGVPSRANCQPHLILPGAQTFSNMPSLSALHPCSFSSMTSTFRRHRTSAAVVSALTAVACCMRKQSMGVRVVRAWLCPRAVLEAFMWVGPSKPGVPSISARGCLLGAVDRLFRALLLGLMNGEVMYRKLQAGQTRLLEFELHEPRMWLHVFCTSEENVRKELRRLIWNQTWLACHLAHSRLGYSHSATSTMIFPGLLRRQDQPQGVRFVKVVSEDMLVFAQRLVEQKKHTVVLNMANSESPGGGIAWGAGSQEEHLHRRTNLHKFLYEQRDGIYPLNDKVLLSRNVVVFRGPETEGYPFLDEPFAVSVVSAAAVYSTHTGAHGPSTDRVMLARMRTLLYVIRQSNCHAAVLSAWGAGASRIDPRRVARLFKEALDSSHGLWHVEFYFCIVEDENSFQSHNSDGNFNPFAETLRGYEATEVNCGGTKRPTSVHLTGRGGSMKRHCGASHTDRRSGITNGGVW